MQFASQLTISVKFPPEERFPFCAVTIPVILSGPCNVTPAGLLIIKSLIVFPSKTSAPMNCAADPFIEIVPSVAVNVPLFVIVPAICIVFPDIVSEDPAFIVKLLTVAIDPELRTGLFATFGIWTIVVGPGINPHDQFKGLFQSISQLLSRSDQK